MSLSITHKAPTVSLCSTQSYHLQMVVNYRNFVSMQKYHRRKSEVSIYFGLHQPTGRLLASSKDEVGSYRPGIQYSSSDMDDNDIALLYATPKSSSEGSSTSSNTTTTAVDPAVLAAAERAISYFQNNAKSINNNKDTNDDDDNNNNNNNNNISSSSSNSTLLESTQRIVETAMLAAVTGLMYSLAVFLKLEGYLSYVLPLPTVLAAVRRGFGASVKALTVSTLLLLIIVGPFRAIAFFLVYGLLALSLSATWSMQLPWSLSVPLAALSRMSGFLVYFALSSFMTNENLLAVMLHNIHALLDQFSAVTGGSGAPSLSAVTITLASLLLVNSTFYVFMMHILYTLVLKGMGYNNVMGKNIPKFLNKFMAL